MTEPIIRSYYDVVADIRDQAIAEGRTGDAAALIHILGRARAANEALPEYPGAEKVVESILNELKAKE